MKQAHTIEHQAEILLYIYQGSEDTGSSIYPELQYFTYIKALQ